MKGGLVGLILLFELGLQWRAFGVHRSAISRTLPPGSGGVAFGDDDNVRRLMRRIILGRPPDRRVFPIWNPDDVFSLFSRWARPLPLRDVLLQIAFLVAMATCGRLSDLASLRVDSGLMTKLDSRTSHIRSSFSLRRLLSALSLLLDCVDSWRGCCVWRASTPLRALRVPPRPRRPSCVAPIWRMCSAQANCADIKARAPDARDAPSAPSTSFSG